MNIKNAINFVRSDKDYSNEKEEEAPIGGPLFSEELLKEDFELAKELDDLPI